MAKSVKEKGPGEIELSDRTVKQFTSKILERFENIESAKGAYMNRARKERDAMVTIYEGLAAQGVPQKVSKLHVKIIRAVEQLKGWIAELEAEEQSLARKMAKAQGSKEQLSLFAALPVAKVAKAAVTETMEKAKAKATKSKAKKGGDAPGVTGEDIAKADAAGEATTEEEPSPMKMKEADFIPPGVRPN